MLSPINTLSHLSKNIQWERDFALDNGDFKLQQANKRFMIAILNNQMQRVFISNKFHHNDISDCSEHSFDNDIRLASSKRTPLFQKKIPHLFAIFQFFFFFAKTCRIQRHK